MSNKTDKALPASDAYPEIEKRGREVFGDCLDFIDSLPDGPGKKLIIPFPYGPGKPRPYGWDMFPELHPSQEDDQYIPPPCNARC